MKVDKGFRLLYKNLSNRRKFIRTIWVVTFTILAYGLAYLIGFSKYLNMNKIFIITCIIIAVFQIVYTYFKWKKEEINNNK